MRLAHVWEDRQELLLRGEAANRDVRKGILRNFAKFTK